MGSVPWSAVFLQRSAALNLLWSVGFLSLLIVPIEQTGRVSPSSVYNGTVFQFGLLEDTHTHIYIKVMMIMLLIIIILLYTNDYGNL